MPDGYSGKPLYTKLGLSPQQEIIVINKPGNYEDLIGIPLQIVEKILPASFMHVFVTKQSELISLASMLAENLQSGGALWVSWPKKSSGVNTDLTENVLREILLPTGLVDVKVCAIDDNWSGLKFVWRKAK